jgi:hypothetical protein
MKNAVIGFVALVSGAALVLLNTASSAHAQISYPSPPRFAHSPIEYKVVDVDEKGAEGERRARFQAQLEPLGKEGWELTEVPTLKGGRQVMLFKRTIR